MGENSMGKAIGILRQLSQSPVTQKLGLHGTLEKAVFYGTKYSINSLENIAMKPSKGKKKQTLQPGQRDPKALFDLTPNEDQTMLQDSVKRLSIDLIRPAAADADHACETPVELLQQIHDLGISHLAIPEEFGGVAADRSPVTQVLIAEALAYGDMGIAVAALAPMAVVNALVDFGNHAQQERYLPLFADENFKPAALAISEPQPLFDPYKLNTKAQQQDGCYLLNGVKTLVPLAGTADLFLVAAETNNKGIQVFIVDAAQNGVSIKAQPAMGIRAAATGTITLKNVSVPNFQRLGEGDESFDYTKLLTHSRIGWAALASGCSQAVLDYVVPYVKERKAFGEPVANRQSVAFMVANIGIELDGMRLMNWRAASQLEQQMDAQQAAWLAHTQAADKGMEIGSNGVQLLGGHGFTKEHPVERWYRQLRVLAVIYGGVSA